MEKVLIGIVTIVILGVCWIKGFGTIESQDMSAQIAANIEFAEEQVALQAYGSACDAYEQVLEWEVLPQHYLRLAEIYDMAGYEAQRISTLKQCLTLFPDNAEAAMGLANYYYDIEEYSDCASYLKHYGTYHQLTDEEMKRYYECKYHYVIHMEGYAEAMDGFGGSYLVKSAHNDYWYYLNAKMKKENIPEMEDASPKFGDLYGVTIEGSANFIDSSGLKYLDSVEKYDKAWSFSGGFALVEKDGKFGYVNSKFRLVLDGLLQATNFASGLAAAQTEEGWKVINSSGKSINEKIYTDVIYDEYRLCSRNGVVFVQENGAYIMINAEGEQIGAESFEDAKPFSSGSYAAVKKNGKWGFVNENGEIILEPQYEDAQSFGQDLAAVSIDGKWGFITAKGRVVIEPQFEGAKHLVNGKVPVKRDGLWYYLSLE